MAKQEPRGRFPNYWCHISQPSNEIDILADLPEEFSYAAMSHYLGPTGTTAEGLGQLVGDMPVVDALAKAAPVAAGGDVAVQSLTKRIWQGTEPLQFSLRLLFDAENNSYEDVHETVTLLASLALPSSFNLLGVTMLSAPNPYRAFDQIPLLGGFLPSSQHNILTIRIGRQYYFPSCVVLSAQPAVDIRLEADGYPIAGAIDLQVCTDTVYHKEDLFRAAGVRTFKTSGAGGPGSTAMPDRSRASDTPGLSPVRLMRLHSGDE